MLFGCGTNDLNAKVAIASLMEGLEAIHHLRSNLIDLFPSTQKRDLFAQNALGKLYIFRKTWTEAVQDDSNGFKHGGY